jgi:ATP-dependent Clp protease ATP-binding subunit ClpB
VVLLDEIEKAHPEVFNVLLQLLDDGRLTDSQGRTVDFRNTIVLMTSNVGSELLREGLPEEEAARRRMDALRAQFRPEFLNRLDGIVSFSPLGREQMLGILDVQLRRLQQRLADRDMQLHVTDGARKILAHRGYDPDFGARPLRRLLQSAIVDPLARGILEGRFGSGSAVAVDVGPGGEVDQPELVLRAAPASAA